MKNIVTICLFVWLIAIPISLMGMANDINDVMSLGVAKNFVKRLRSKKSNPTTIERCVQEFLQNNPKKISELSELLNALDEKPKDKDQLKRLMQCFLSD